MVRDWARTMIDSSIQLVGMILALVRKELLVLFKEPANRIILFVPALLQAMLYGYVATYDLNHAPYAVLDQSHSVAAERLLAGLDGGGQFQRVGTLTSTGQIRQMIDTGQALFVLTISPDFADRLVQGGTAPVQVILDGRNPVSAGLASGYLASIVSTFNAQWAQLHPAGAAAAGPGVRVERRAWYNPNLMSRWTLMPGLIASLSLMQTLLLAALSVAREREQGTFDQLLVTPLTPLQILVGKAVAPVLVGLMQSTIILLIIRYWFQIPLAGTLGSLYVGLLVFTTAAVGVGLSISALALTMQQAMLYAFLLVMPMTLLSGLVTPIRNMPWILQMMTYANPLRFGVEIARRIYLEGAGLDALAASFMPLLVLTLLTLPAAAWLFRNRLV